MHKVAVIGLGRFGMSLARQLGQAGIEVIATDRNPHLVDEVKDDVDVAVRLDSTDEDAIKAQRIHTADICVVAIGENFEAAILTTVLLRRLGRGKIICRAQTPTHAEIFRSIGADEIIQPESQAGELLGKKLANPQLDRFIELADGYSLIELRAPTLFRGKSLEQLGLRTKYHVNLVAIKRPDPERAPRDPNGSRDGSRDRNGERPMRIISVPRPGDIIEPHDVLVLVGNHDALQELPKE